MIGGTLLVFLKVYPRQRLPGSIIAQFTSSRLDGDQIKSHAMHRVRQGTHVRVRRRLGWRDTLQALRADIRAAFSDTGCRYHFSGTG
jgi:hypothetical protein